jgi:hypothetical protein
MFGRSEVLGELTLADNAGELDLAVAVEQQNGGARRRLGGERTRKAFTSLRGPQRALESGSVEDVPVAL